MPGESTAVCLNSNIAILMTDCVFLLIQHMYIRSDFELSCQFLFFAKELLPPKKRRANGGFYILLIAVLLCTTFREIFTSETSSEQTFTFWQRFYSMFIYILYIFGPAALRSTETCMHQLRSSFHQERAIRSLVVRKKISLEWEGSRMTSTTACKQHGKLHKVSLRQDTT